MTGNNQGFFLGTRHPIITTHEKNSICSPKKLNDIAHEHTIICRQLFAGHVVGSRPMKRKKHLHRLIKLIVVVVVAKNTWKSSKSHQNHQM